MWCAATRSFHLARKAAFKAPAPQHLIDDLTDKASKDCPVAAALTDADRAKLLQIKQGIEKAGKS
jgi:hypothetical protein